MTNLSDWPVLEKVGLLLVPRVVDKHLLATTSNPPKFQIQMLHSICPFAGRVYTTVGAVFDSDFSEKAFHKC